MTKYLLPFLFLSPVYLCGLIIGYWIFIDEWLYPADIISGPAWAMPFLVEPGGVITVHYTLDTQRICPRVFQTWVTNGVVTTFEDHHGVSSGLGHRVISLNTKLPAGIEFGVHRYHVRGIWSCNPLIDQVIMYPVIEFEVVVAR